MAQSMKVFGNQISTTVEESFTMRVVIYMRVNSSTTWLKALVSTGTPTALSMSGTGTKTNSTALVKKSGTTVANIRDSTKMHLRKARESIAGPTATDMLESGATTCSMAKVYSFGMMIGCS
jgi:hypothetical protein